MNNFDPSKFRTPELFQKLLDIAPQDPHSAVLEEVEEHIMALKNQVSRMETAW